MKPMTPEAAAAQLEQGRCEGLSPMLLAQGSQFIVDELAVPQATVAPAPVRLAMGALNHEREFALSRGIGQAWHDTRGCDALIQKHLVQALIELGAFALADTMLDEALEAAARSTDLDFATQLPEYRGLRGRVFKQRFVLEREPRLLRASTDAYLEQYKQSGSFHHGVNVLALCLLETELQLPRRADIDPRTLATGVLESARSARFRDPTPWPLSTASEACLALDRLDGGAAWADQAELWLHRFLAHERCTPFTTESYHRQLREVWQGDMLRNESCADRLVSIIGRHVMRAERRWSVDPARVVELAADAGSLEKNFSGERTFSVDNLRSMLGLCPSIGYVLDANDVRRGTGFLIAGGAFGLPHELVFVTNAHVISPSVPMSLRHDEARVSFEAGPAANGERTRHRIKDILFTSEPAEIGEVLDKPEKLDVTIVALDPPPTGVQGLKPASELPYPSPKTKAFVVGHPNAGPLQFSLTDSVLLDVCGHERLLHYRTPTDPGSSGSPVFNSNWEVIALHHAGSQTARRLNGVGEYEANEGISLQAIGRGVKSHLKP